MSIHGLRKCIPASLILGLLAAGQHDLLRADVTGTILGNVRDATGAAVVGARVAAVNTQTNLRQQAVSDQSGEYRLQALPIGTYRVEAEAIGFEKYHDEQIIMKVAELHRGDI